jgi:hypothetical protein
VAADPAVLGEVELEEGADVFDGSAEPEDVLESAPPDVVEVDSLAVPDESLPEEESFARLSLR